MKVASFVLERADESTTYGENEEPVKSVANMQYKLVDENGSRVGSIHLHPNGASLNVTAKMDLSQSIGDIVSSIKAML